MIPVQQFNNLNPSFQNRMNFQQHSGMLNNGFQNPIGFQQHSGMLNNGFQNPIGFQQHSGMLNNGFQNPIGFQQHSGMLNNGFQNPIGFQQHSGMLNNGFQNPIDFQQHFGMLNNGFQNPIGFQQHSGMLNNGFQNPIGFQQHSGMLNNGFQNPMNFQQSSGLLNNGLQLTPQQLIPNFCTNFQIPTETQKYVDPTMFETVDAAVRLYATELDEQLLALDDKAKLGEGSFGTVYKGTYDEKSVAVKVLNDKINEKSQNDFLYEAAIMGQFDHSNVIKFIGVASKSFIIVTEFMKHGSLKIFLQNNQLGLRVLQRFISDIASGMKYLHDMNYIHRDLAARNILVSSEWVCKVSDFGLTRSLKPTDGDSQEEPKYTKKKNHLFPKLWTAPEAVFGEYVTKKSDVWSFGIVMWEILTGGEDPYKRLSMSDDEILQKVREGGFLNPLPNWPCSLQHLMRECFRFYPGERPHFCLITDYLSKFC